MALNQSNPKMHSEKLGHELAQRVKAKQIRPKNAPFVAPTHDPFLPYENFQIQDHRH